MGTTRLLYARAVIQTMKWDRTTAREMVLVAVMTGENSRAGWNPMDTTMPSPGATPYNSFGPHGEYHVWNYADARLGVEATCATLRQENMRPWVDVMASPRLSAVVMAKAFAECPWAGVGDLTPMHIVEAWQNKQRRYASDAHTWVEGQGPWTYRNNGKPR